MHAKYVLGLILVLQVSLSLCQIPEPSQELVDKYKTLKAKFYSRLEKLKLMDQVTSLIEQSEALQGARKLVESMDPNNKLQAERITSILRGLEPMVEKARMLALGMYEHYLRPYLGTALDGGIAAAQPVLDAVMPSK